MRRLIFALVALAFSFNHASAAPVERCLLDKWLPSPIIWWEGDTLRGMRVISRDPNWNLKDHLVSTGPSDLFERRRSIWNITSERYITASCETCAEGRGLVATLKFGIPAPVNPNLDEMVGPKTFQELIAGRLEFRPKSEPQSFSLGEFVGRARIYQLVWHDRRTFEVMVAAVVTGCVTFFGQLRERNFDQISFDALKEFASAIAIEPFTPTPRPRIKKFDLGEQ